MIPSLKKSKIKLSDKTSKVLVLKLCTNTTMVIYHQVMVYMKNNAQHKKYHNGTKIYVSNVHSVLLAVHTQLSDHSQSRRIQRSQKISKRSKVKTKTSLSLFHKLTAEVVVSVKRLVQRVHFL